MDIFLKPQQAFSENELTLEKKIKNLHTFQWVFLL